MAEKLSVYKAPHEPILIWYQQKPDGSPRQMCRFGPIRQSQQYLVHDILRVHAAGCGDYALQGGALAAANRILKRDVINGSKWYVVLDIANFFDSIDRDGLEALLPLPKSVTRAVVAPELNTPHGKKSPESVMLPVYTLGAVQGKGLHGIPTGAVTSNPVAALVVSSITNKVAPRDKVIAYRDDAVIEADDEAGAHKTLDAIEHMLQDHPCGPFSLKTGQVASVSHGFAFLGYYFRIAPDRFGGQFRARYSYDSLDKFRYRLIKMMLEAKSFVERYDRGLRYLGSWANSFPAFKPTTSEQSFLECTVSDAADTITDIPPECLPYISASDICHDKAHGFYIPCLGHGVCSD